MAINIKNERVVALARELAQVRGVTLTSAIEEALAARLDEVQSHPSQAEQLRAERLARIRAAVADLQFNLTQEERDALTTAERDMYDENGLPVW